MALEKHVRDLCKGVNLAVLTSLSATGSPQAQVVWIDCDDDHVIVNTLTRRQKFENVKRDPRVTVVVLETGEPDSFVEVRGRVVETIDGHEARAHHRVMATKYAASAQPSSTDAERVILRIIPDRQLVFEVE